LGGDGRCRVLWTRGGFGSLIASIATMFFRQPGHRVLD
jgi:hypothetical protein